MEIKNRADLEKSVSWNDSRVTRCFGEKIAQRQRKIAQKVAQKVAEPCFC
jgi:hypothetical protein